jgi:predicted membrane-bound dolichyl-phosphate-mannose-protein mannosyltransferase
MVLVLVAFVVALSIGVALRQRVTIAGAMLGLALVVSSAASPAQPAVVQIEIVP